MSRRLLGLPSTVLELADRNHDDRGEHAHQWRFGTCACGRTFADLSHGGIRWECRECELRRYPPLGGAQ